MLTEKEQLPKIILVIVKLSFICLIVSKNWSQSPNTSSVKTQYYIFYNHLFLNPNFLKLVKETL